jgi:hypothetical protein
MMYVNVFKKEDNDFESSTTIFIVVLGVEFLEAVTIMSME